MGVKPDANQTVKCQRHLAILGLGGEAFKWVFNMYDKCYTPSLIRLVEKAMKKAHGPMWRPVGPMAVPTFSKKLPLAMKRAAPGDLGHLRRQLLAQGCSSWTCTSRRTTVCLKRETEKSAMGMAATLPSRTTAPLNSSITSFCRLSSAVLFFL